PDYGDADHDRMKRESERQIGDHPDRDRDRVVTDATDRDRRRAGISAPLQRYPIEHRPAQERTEQEDRAEIAVGEQMRRRPQFYAREHRMLQRDVDPPADVG